MAGEFKFEFKSEIEIELTLEAFEVTFEGFKAIFFLGLPLLGGFFLGSDDSRRYFLWCLHVSDKLLYQDFNSF